jgi:hypothetical protein
MKSSNIKDFIYEKIMAHGASEDEVRTAVDQLGLHAANLRGILATTEGETIQAPALNAKCYGREGHLTKAVSIFEHITELEHRLGDAAPKFQFSNSPPTSSMTAAPESTANITAGEPPKISELQAVLNPPGVKTYAELMSERLKATEPSKISKPMQAVLDARGVKTYAELVANAEKFVVPD